jgi:hypothetical protein
MLHTGSYPIDEVFFALCKHVNTPISLSLWLRFKYAPQELLDFSLPIGDYLEYDREKFAGDYLCSEYLSKYKGHKVNIDVASVALEKFDASEMICRETNVRIKEFRSKASDPWVSARIFRAKNKIAKLLGPASIHCISPYFGWSPGATFDRKRREAHVDEKMTAAPITVSGRALELLESVIRYDLHWSYALLGQFPEGDWRMNPSVFSVVDSCRITTVPKSSKTDRVIAIEPTGNIYLQKGVGGYFRRCLKRRGIDLDNQAVNQGLAALAARDNLATLDLKAASDTVSRELVYELLPPDWAFLLDALRSHTALMPDGSKVRLEKWSSMGNGYTFELESLIFWALCDSVREDVMPGGVLSVYGDDLIVSSTYATRVIELLQFCGFSVNSDKTHITGLFYESCGRHYFNDSEVTPCYQKEIFTKEAEFIRAHNRLVRWASRVGQDPKDLAPASRLRRDCPKGLRACISPYGDLADTGFLVSLDEIFASTYRLDVNRGFRLRAVIGSTRRLPGVESAYLALSLRKLHERHAEKFPLGIPPNCLDRQNYIDGKPVYAGDLHVSDEDPTRARLGWRWVVPPGVCLLA